MSDLKRVGDGLMAAGGIAVVVSEKTVICEKHGEYVQKTFGNNKVSMCSGCVDYLDKANAEAQAAIEEAQAAKARVRAVSVNLGASQIPMAFVGKSIKSYIPKNESQKEAKKLFTDFIQEFEGEHSGRWITLIGPCGVGKTHLAAASCQGVIKWFQKTAICTTASEIDRVIREAKAGHSDKTEVQLFRAYTSCDLLVIDEADLGSGTEAQKRDLTDILSARSANKRPVILTSNKDFDQLQEVLGERIIDRMSDYGGVVFSIVGESQRGVE